MGGTIFQEEDDDMSLSRIIDIFNRERRTRRKEVNKKVNENTAFRLWIKKVLKNLDNLLKKLMDFCSE